MLRCGASFVTAEYAKYASFLMVCAPRLRIFLRSRQLQTNFQLFRGYSRFPGKKLMHDLSQHPFNKITYFL
jgi:hypothetical protein